ncbi:MAG TPA: CrcB family protein [Dermatophilaceae bacterium]|nr:CrcB family protein [Dermatophilaceae bacterium]
MPERPPQARAGADVDLRLARGRPVRRDEAAVLAVVAAGGAAGALARYGIGQAWPTDAARFPATTLGINLVGCALIGILMVLVSDVWTGHRLLRPFLGTGLLGGFTTFSTYAVDVQRLTTTGHAAAGLAYLLATPLGALVAVWGTAAGTRRLVERRKR